MNIKPIKITAKNEYQANQNHRSTWHDSDEMGAALHKQKWHQN
jgi:hypothetical protein